MNALAPEFSAVSTALLRARVAMMVDGENIPAAMAGQILSKAAGYGDLIIKRVYGNAQKTSGWDMAPGFRMVHSGVGKNATDLLLTVEAMAVMLSGQADVLVVVASDRDDTHLTTHLCEAGHRVIGLGEPKAPAAFRKSCTRFIDLVLHQPIAPTPAVVVTTGVVTKHSAIDTRILTLIASDGGKDGLPIACLGRMGALFNVRPSDTPEKSWRKYLKARLHLFACEPKGPTANVRAVLPKPAPHTAP